MDIMIKKTNGLLDSNCYFICSGSEGAIIDPGADLEKIKEIIEETECTVRYILITHVHLDHISAVDKLRENTGAPVLVHINEAGYLPDAWYNGSAIFGLNRQFNEADRFLKDGELIPLGDINLEILHTPGHTPGCICIKAGNSLFTGDTLFYLSVGRTDLGNGSIEDIKASLKKLMTLDDGIEVYPGHGSRTTIGFERKNNPWLD
ncbi:MAG: MBL fold metallo-hydrolase [Eubacteriales bacterium]|nr:MBL fold metallo-hydrolase [Eubacteriales bacterium]